MDKPQPVGIAGIARIQNIQNISFTATDLERGEKRNSNDMSCQMRTTDSFSSSSALIAFFEGSSSVHQSVLALHMNTSVAATDNYITAFLHKTR